MVLATLLETKEPEKQEKINYLATQKTIKNIRHLDSNIL